jgi:RNA polymerase sigma factor (sigma-70 family)
MRNIRSILFILNCILILPGNPKQYCSEGIDLFVITFEEKVEQYEPMIFHIIKKLNLYQNHDEYYQLGLIGIWEAVNRFNPEKGKFSSFVYTTIKGKMLTKLNKDKQWEEFVLFDNGSVTERVEDQSHLNLFEEEMLLIYCNDLSEKQTLWVIQTFLKGKTTEEISKEFGVSLSAVKKWKKMAVEKIKLNLQLHSFNNPQ